jgi:signal transduction histidine kinase/ligand-binding sensor domain-containing protein
MTDSRNKQGQGQCIKKLFYGCLFFPAFLCAQKFHFQNYNVQQGLIQSQVSAITQDHFDNLWFCTLGGISRYDGKDFTNYSETDGLISNYSNSILADHDSNIWVGTMNGISRFNGSSFKNIQLTESPAGNMVRAITEDGAHRIWVLASGKLFLMDTGEKPVRKDITGLYERVTAIQVDRQGMVNSAIMGKGIFRLEKGDWKMVVPLPENSERGFCQKMIFDAADPGRMYLLTSNELLVSEKGAIRSLFPAGSLGKFTNMYLDRSGRLWLTGSQGLFQYSETGLTAFNPENGYEGSKTTVIYQDREDNIWFGTNGTGVFRYSYQPFLIFDQFNAAQNRGVMPMLQHGNRLFLGTEGSGLYIYDGKNIRAVNGFSNDPADQNITGLFQGNENEIYVLASSGLLKKYSNGKFSKVSLGEVKGCINSVIPDERGGFWVASCWGFLNISAAGKTTRILNTYSGRILRVSKDSLLVSADDGLYLVANDFTYRKINDPLLNKASYMSLAILGKYFLLATSNKGFIMYNSMTGKHLQYTTKEGMNADFIYSVATDHRNQVWLGTGRGVNKIKFDTATEAIQITSLSIPGDISSAECNQAGALYDENKNLWIGTVYGLFKFLPDSVKKQNYFPPVILQEVQVFSKEIPPRRSAGFLNNWYSIPKDLRLAHNENHLSFSFRCPSYLQGESILYQYQLEGLEKTYSALTPNHYVVYPALPPGHYTFRARAWLEGHGYSTENVNFSFDIRAAFYQTLYFKFGVLVLLMGIILWIQWLRIRMRVNRINQIEEVKREENIKVRQTASEDFHDEVGNSLTRIQVLTDVLQAKLGTGHEEEKRLIGQIKENVSGLYQGTRDILWALNPESDMVKEIGHRLESLGIDVFQDTGICFSYENILGESENVRLPGNFNRNIMMIFKEAMSNCLKHAQASQVKLKIQKTELPEIRIGLSDDGLGFNPLYIKKGHGFQNMQKRANRMKALFSISSHPGEGTRYELRIPVSDPG